MELDGKILRNKSLNTKLHRDGYVVLDFIDQDSLKALVDFWEKNKPESFEGIFGSFFLWNADLIKETNRLVVTLLNKKVEEMLYDWYIDGAAFITKHPSANEYTNFELHQDPNVIDEKDVPSMALWIPLIDTDKSNGGLCVLPGSHRYFKGTVRGVNIPSLYLPISNEIEKVVKHLEVKAGQVCIYFHSTFHGSLPNYSSNSRPVIHAGLIPKGSTTLHYYKTENADGNKRIEIFKQNPKDFHLFVSDPKSYPQELLGILESYTPTPSKEDVLIAYGLRKSESKLWMRIKKFLRLNLS